MAAGGRPCGPPLGLRLSKKWLAPLFRGFHSSLAPTARPGSYAEKPLLRKAFCGFAVHAAKSDYSLRGLRPPNPRGFFDRLRRMAGAKAPAIRLSGRYAPRRRPPAGPAGRWKGAHHPLRDAYRSAGYPMPTAARKTPRAGPRRWPHTFQTSGNPTRPPWKRSPPLGTWGL